MRSHYGTAILPARPARPRDKAKVEAAVLVVERWILARLRNETFFSLDALNERICELLEDLNDRPMRAYGKSRRELFERLDRPALKPLPAERFVYGEWKLAKVSIDYHVQIDHHCYSVSLRLGGRVRRRAQHGRHGRSLSIRGSRVASHARSYRHGGFTTVAEHMPKSHQKHLEWTPSRLIHWASTRRTEDRAARRGHSHRAPSPRAGLPLVSGNPAARESLRKRSGSRRRVLAPWPCAPARTATSTRS